MKWEGKEGGSQWRGFFLVVVAGQIGSDAGATLRVRYVRGLKLLCFRSAVRAVFWVDHFWRYHFQRMLIG